MAYTKNGKVVWVAGWTWTVAISGGGKSKLGKVIWLKTLFEKFWDSYWCSAYELEQTTSSDSIRHWNKFVLTLLWALGVKIIQIYGHK